jgi:undecaprenyl-diphosphatase
MLEYGKDYPTVYALSLIPLYVGVARVKAQAHWQSDVVAGWAVGGLAGWYAHERDSPLLLQVMPHGIFVGLKKSF